MIWDALEKREAPELEETIWTSFEKGDEEKNNNGFGECTYFSCLKIISESIAKCPIIIKKETPKGDIPARDHMLYDILRIRPNDYMNAVNAVKTYVLLGKHYGISGLYIDRRNNRIQGLYPVRITGITVDDVGLIKSNKSNKILYDFEGSDGECGSCFDRDLIIFRDMTMDAIHAKPTKQLLHQCLDTSIKSQSYQNKLFGNGMTNKLAVQLVSDVKEEKDLKKIQAKFERIYSNTGRIFTIPANYTVTPLNLTMVDSQFAELRKMSKEDIAGALSVPLSKLGIIKENAKSEEQDDLSFLNDCLQVIITQIEQEMDYKLLTAAERRNGYKIRFNVGVLLRLDAKTQAEVINTYIGSGVYSLQKAQDILGVEKYEGDPIVTLPSGQILLKDLLAGKASYQTGEEDNA